MPTVNTPRISGRVAVLALIVAVAGRGAPVTKTMVARSALWSCDISAGSAVSVLSQAEEAGTIPGDLLADVSIGRSLAALTVAPEDTERVSGGFRSKHATSPAYPFAGAVAHDGRARLSLVPRLHLLALSANPATAPPRNA